MEKVNTAPHERGHLMFAIKSDPPGWNLIILILQCVISKFFDVTIVPVIPPFFRRPDPKRISLTPPCNILNSISMTTRIYSFILYY